jgi:pimeloyl-ACP methyl ester carboxylesterase
MATYVLVHGAWHGGWCWQRVASLLRRAGHDVFTPTLTGLGERSHLASPEVDLNTHVKDILGVLEYEDLRDVILVGHSYGGMVITGVADKAGDRLAHIVYLDAFVPQDGQSVFSLLPPEAVSQFRQLAKDKGEGWRLLPLPMERLGVTREADVHWVTSKLVLHPVKTFEQPLRLTNPAAAPSRRTYIFCTAPRIGGFEQFAKKVRADPGWRFHEFATGHDAMVTEPRKLADLLLEAAA